MEVRNFLIKFHKPLQCSFFAILFFVLAFLGNTPDGFYELPLEAKANKVVVVEGFKSPDSHKVSPSIFYEEHYELLLLSKKGPFVMHFGELPDGRWIQSSEWINIAQDLPLFGMIKKVEAENSKIIVNFGRNTTLIIFFLILAVFNLFFAFGLLHSTASVKFEIKRG